MSIWRRIENRMMKRCLVYIFLLFSLVLPQAASAVPVGGLESVGDTINVADGLQDDRNSNKKEKYEAENRGFDARGFVFQKRYRIPVKTKFDNSKFFSHFYIGVGGGVEHINRRGKYNYKTGSSYSFFIGKDVAQDHSLSVAFRFGNNMIKDSDIELDKLGVQLNYHFHLTRYFLGYNPNRLIDVSTTIGVGYQKAKVWRNSAESVYGMLGLTAGTFLMILLLSSSLLGGAGTGLHCRALNNSLLAGITAVAV